MFRLRQCWNDERHIPHSWSEWEADELEHAAYLCGGKES